MADPMQSIRASDGSTISHVTQVIADKYYSRSQAEELRDYLAQAVAAFEARMYQLVARPPAPPDQPYKFLYAFEIEDADIFFGRDDASRALYQTVLKDRLAVLHARSGAGKTSLLKAGLSPRLIRAAHLPVYARTYDDPTQAIKLAIAPPSLSPWPELLPKISLHEFLSLVCAQLNRQTRELVIILDQFEDLFVFLPEPDLRQRFMQMLSECCADRSLPIRFVIAVRQENLGHLDEFQQLIPHILHNRFMLLPMTESEVEDAVIRPIWKLGKDTSFESALLETLIDDFRQSEVELTHLQLVCTRLYESLPPDGKVITTELYHSLGGIRDILTAYLNDTLDALPSELNVMARNILKEMVTSKATRWVVSLPALQRKLTPDTELIESGLTRLVNARLVHREEVSSVSGVVETRYELAHTCLAQEIHRWIDRDSRAIKEIQELLQGELASWPVHQTSVSGERLDLFRAHLKDLDLDLEAQELLLRSAIGLGHDISFWLAQFEDKEVAIGWTAESLVSKPHLRKRITADLGSSLEQPLRHPLLSTLWATFDGVTGTDRQCAARALWALRSWLSKAQLLRVFVFLVPIWVGQVWPFIVPIVLLLTSLVWMWPYLTRTRAMPGGWKRIDEGQFVMGIEENQAKETYSMCREGATEISREKCTPPEELYRWSRKRLNAWLPTFYIMENEVTNAQYRRCVSEGPCEPPGKEPGDCSYESNVNCPVTEVTWVDAMTYCMWLDGRLPTEEEWEKAARGPSGNYFPWGSGWDLSIANLEVYTSGSAQSIENYAKDESFYGVKNLAGNVQEWTASEYVDFSVVMFENEDLPCELKDNAPTCDVDNSMDVVIRGGAWGNAHSVGLGWSRYPSWPYARRKEIGFRCVCPSDQLTCKSPWELQWRWFGEY